MTPAEEAARAFAERKAPHIVENTIRNLARLTEIPLVAPSRMGAALVVGAGPSLDEAHLEQLAARAHTLTVNTAARAVCERIAPDVLVARESLDVSAHIVDLRHKPGVIALDIGCHAQLVEAALAEVGPGRVAFFIPAALDRFWLAASLHLEPVYGGTASLTAAVALAERCSSTSIALAGVDLAFRRGDGRGYSAATPFAAVVASPGPTGDTVRIEGGDAQRELAESSGHHPPPRVQRTTLVEANDGGEPVRATGPWLDQIEWLETFAARRPDVRLHRGNGVALLRGWRPGWPAESYRDGGRLSLAMARPEHVEAARREYNRQIDCALRITEAYGVGQVARVPDLLDGCGAVEMHAAGAMFAVNDARLPPAQALDAMRDAIAASAMALAARSGEYR